MKTLHFDDIDQCLACPLYVMNYKEGYFYCGHIEAPESHIIKKVTMKDDKGYYIADFEVIEDYLPDWCPLPDTSKIIDRLKEELYRDWLEWQNKIQKEISKAQMEDFENKFDLAYYSKKLSEGLNDGF